MLGSSAIVSVAAIRHGGAVVLRADDGTRYVARAIDLARADARANRRGVGDNARLIETAVLDGDRIHITHRGGVARSFAIDTLLYERARRADARRCDLALHNARLITARPDATPDNPLGVLDDASVFCDRGRVVWVGPSVDADRAGYTLDGDYVNAGGRLVSPGLVDCHAHPLFAGDRADEFGRRAAGQSYLEIAAAGGGIQATVGPTRQASVDEHIGLTALRMSRALAAGTTTCEAKSGYDLTSAGELRLLEIARAVDGLHAMDLAPTLLGAHVVPAEYADDRAGYVAEVIERMIPSAAAGGLAEAVDVYCDQGAFTLDETRRILTTARDHDLRVRAHVGQFADLGAAELVAELGGLSADHLEVVSPAGIAAMAAAGVVAVMLPGACVQLRMTPPPVAALRAAGVAMAVATDMNPGTTSCEILSVPMWLATTHYGMTVPEVWLGVTRVAAQALGRPDVGVIAPGYAADMVMWDASGPAEIPYRYGVNLAQQVIKAGFLVRPL